MKIMVELMALAIETDSTRIMNLSNLDAPFAPTLTRFKDAGSDSETRIHAILCRRDTASRFGK